MIFRLYHLSQYKLTTQLTVIPVYDIRMPTYSADQTPMVSFEIM